MKFIKAYHFGIFIFVTVLIFFGMYYYKSIVINKNSADDVFKLAILTEKKSASIYDKKPNEETLLINEKILDIKISTIAPKKVVKSQEKIEFNLGFNTVQEAEKFYYLTITKNTIKCKNHVRLGRQDDGGWDVCFDGNFALKPGNCLSYSFGVNYIWEFDDAVASKYQCIVRTFDPSMDKEADEYQRSSQVWFYKIGLGKEDTRWSNGWNIMKMSSILKKFQESYRIIDILKIDIEFSEWDSFESMVKDGLLSKVKQIMFETHTEEVQGRTTTKENFIRFLKVWNSLYEAGFRQWKNSWNHFGNYLSRHTAIQRTCCYEHYLININYM